MNVIKSTTVSSFSVNVKDNKVVTFIYNEKNRNYFVLKDVVAEVWNFLLIETDYQKIYSFVKSKIQKDKLDEIIAEFKYYNLITTDFNISKKQFGYISLAINENDNNFDSFFKYRNEIKHKKYPLDMLYLQLNYNCNLTCKHCFNHKNMNEYEINFENATSIIDDACKLGVETITLSGGECTLNKSFIDIAKYIRKKHIKLRVLTNGIELYNNENLFNELVLISPSEIKTSLYSMDSNIHDYITSVKGSHYKTLSAIKKLRKHNIKVVINSFQTSLNIGCYKEVEKFANSIGATFATSVQLINNIDNKNKYTELDNINKKKYYLDECIFKTRKEQNIDPSSPVCGAGTNFLSIAPNLDVHPCLDVDYRLGNIKENSLLYIWENTLPDFRKFFINKNRKECFKYEYCKFCDYCPTNAVFETEFMKSCPSCCNEAKCFYETYLSVYGKTK